MIKALVGVGVLIFCDDVKHYNKYSKINIAFEKVFKLLYASKLKCKIIKDSVVTKAILKIKHITLNT